MSLWTDNVATGEQKARIDLGSQVPDKFAQNKIRFAIRLVKQPCSSYQGNNRKMADIRWHSRSWTNLQIAKS